MTLNLPETGGVPRPKEGNSTSSSHLPWIWIVEYLSCVPQIQNSLLLDIVESVPEIMKAGDATEVLALRCLELLLGDNPNDNSRPESPSDLPQIEPFDHSFFCIDALERVVAMDPNTNIKRRKFNNLRCDILPYLANKRASLRKSFLERVRDSLHATDVGQSPISNKLEKEAVKPCSGASEQCCDTFVDTDKPKSIDNDEEDEAAPLKKNENISVEKERFSPDSTQMEKDGNERDKNDFDDGKRFSESSGKEEKDTERLPQQRRINEGEVSKEDISSEDTSTDGYGHLFEKVDVAMEKERFLCSRGMSTDEYAGHKSYVCIVCKEDGHLLECSTVGCPLMVHERCLPTPPVYNNGSFSCDFCACSLIFSELHDVRKRARQAWRNLRAFKHAVRLNQDDSNAKEGRKISEISNVHPADKVNCSDSSPHIPPSNQKEKVSEERICRTETNRQEVGDDVSDVQAGSSSANMGDETNPNSTNTKRTRRNGRRFSSVSPSFPQLKRKRIPWSAEEEEALKEGVKKFAVAGESIPWTVIMEFGDSVFKKTRTTIDLKDKWRNICKKSQKTG